MKNPPIHRVLSPVTYLLSCLCFLLCLLAQPARATIPSGLTLSPGLINGATGAHIYNAPPADSFTVTGGGPGWIFNGSDGGYFAYTTVTGDVEIVARLLSFSYSVTGSQAGLMIRQSNLVLEVNRAATWFWPNMGGSGINDLGWMGGGPPVAGNAGYYSCWNYLPKGVNPPYWLKLVRVGNNFGSYWSLDGRNWALISNQSGGALFGTGTMNVGLFVSSNGGASVSATFDNVSITTPQLKYKTSWVGNTFGGRADGFVSSRIHALWVKPDGTCYSNTDWDEAGEPVKAYKDGKVAFACKLWGLTPHLVNSGLTEGNIAGNTTHIFMATSDPYNGVYRTDHNLDNPLLLTFTTPLGIVGGLAASDTQLFVSDTTYGTVHIFNLASGTPTETAPIPAGQINHPGPIAYDAANNCFWIIDCGSPFALTDCVSTQATYTPGVKCFSPAGVYLRSLPAGLTNPTALAKHPNMDRLLVCENGLNQNIQYYSNLSSTPTASGSFGLGSVSGQPGGIWRSSSPGLLYESGNGDWQRFYGPTGVGVDSLNNIYVACNGTHYGGTDLRKFDSAGNLVWKQFGLEFVNCGDFDPIADEIYTTEERFTMNYANTAPGSEWSFTAWTKNPFQANDVRNLSAGGVNGVQIRRVPGNGNVFMYTNGQGTGQPLAMFRFNNQGTSFQGTTAKPFGRIYNTTSPLGFKVWIDKTSAGTGIANGLEDSDEYTQVESSRGGLNSYDVDSQGDIWLTQGSGIARVPCTGTQTITTGLSPTTTAVIPAYNPAGTQFFLCPAPIQILRNIKYDRANDVMYCMGQKTDGKWVLARYDNWLSCPTPDDHPARYVIPLPDLGTDLTILFTPGDEWYYNGMAFAGDKVFVADNHGPIRVYDANLGNPVITLNPGPETSASMGWDDMIMGLNATKRGSEYLILECSTGGPANIPLYRWTPTADTTVPGVPTNLTATAQGHAVALAWTGPLGTPTSYNIYRGTVSGSLTFYQSNVNAASYVDVNVTPGTTYYYTVAAVSAVGTGAQSNQASAAPAGAQAEFVKYDTTTQGTWKTVYGTEGYNIAGQPLNLPPSTYLTSLTPVNTRSDFWATDPVSDVRFLQMVTGTNRTSAYYPDAYGSYEQSWEVDFADNSTWHQVSIYLLDWTSHPQGVKVEVLVKGTTTVLDTRQPMDYYSGKWLVWNVRGDVTIRLTNTTGSFPNLSGVFFDPVQTPAPTKAWWKLDDTSGLIATDSSGAGNNATKVGGTWTAAGRSGGAGCIAFGGTGATSNLSLPTLVFNLPKMTLSLWFKTNASGVLLGMQNLPSSPTVIAPVLYVGTDNKLHGAFNTGAIRTMKSAATVTSATTWHHAALTSDGLVQTLYLDGEVSGMQVAPVTMLGYAWCGQGTVTGWPNTMGTQMFFNGLVDEVRLYNRVVPSSEIWKLKN